MKHWGKSGPLYLMNDVKKVEKTVCGGLVMADYMLLSSICWFVYHTCALNKVHIPGIHINMESSSTVA